MLHNIDENGNIFWHCHTPGCTYHNCANWDEGINCKVHEGVQRNQPPGQTLTAHISHPALVWTEPKHVMLPPCPECQEKRGIIVQTGINVYDEDEIAQPHITKDELTGKILQVSMHPDMAHHGNLWFVDKDIVRKQIPHPTLEHLTPSQIEELRADIKSRAPNAPTDWMISESVQEDIHAVYPHPALARHRTLRDQLHAAGNVYTEPEPSLTEPTLTLSQIKEMVRQMLKEHGIEPLADTDKQPIVRPNDVETPPKG